MRANPTPDVLIAFSVVSGITVVGIGMIIEVFLGLMGIQVGATPVLLSWLMILPVLLIVLPEVLRRTTPHFVLVTMMCAVLFVCTALLHWQDTEYYLLLGVNVLPAFSLLYFAGAVRDFDVLLVFLQVAAGLVSVGVLATVLLGKPEAIGDYSQTLAFVLLPAAVILVDTALAFRRPRTIALALTSATLLFAMGARGPVVCLLIYTSLRIVLLLSENKQRLFRVGPIVLATGGAVVAYSKSILSALSETLHSFGLSTRATDLLAEGTIFEDTARQQLADYAMDSIRQNPQFGIGLAQDRLYLMRRMGAGMSPEEAMGWYPHNIVLELVMQFGVIIGPLIVIAVLGLVTFAILRGNSAQSRVVMIYVGIGLLPLMFSRSYLQWPEFFILVGLCLSVLRINRPEPPHSGYSRRR